MDADPGTPEGDELGLLVEMVEMYEKTKYPIDPPASVEALKFRSRWFKVRNRGKPYSFFLYQAGTF